MTILKTLAAALVAVTLTTVAASSATLTATLLESGDDVVLSFSGSIDTTGLTLERTTTGEDPRAIVVSVDAQFGIASGSFDLYTPPVEGPAFGTIFAPALTTDATGDSIYISYGRLLLPVGYVSGTDISASAVFADTTLAQIYATPGVYEYTFPDNTVTLYVGTLPPTAEVPLPASGLLLIAALGGLALRRRPAR